MSRYNKLIGALVGNAVAIGLAFLATRAPGIAECVPVDPVEPPLDAESFDQICSILGYSQAQVTGFLMLLVNSAAVYFSPANRPPA